METIANHYQLLLLVVDERSTQKFTRITPQSLGENGKLLQQFNNGDNPKIHRCAAPLTCSLLTRFGRRLPMAWRSPRPRWYFPP